MIFNGKKFVATALKKTQTEQGIGCQWVGMPGLGSRLSTY